ncbi:MAG: hypothetical protein H7210_05895, partial [Pyrinomonadaceae bacterium]|nr:hypothetical protein [Phycisphaerales bacterium]
ARIGAINSSFDDITVRLSKGELSPAIKALNELSASLLPSESDINGCLAAWSLSVQFSPDHVQLDSPNAAIVLTGMYPIESRSPITLWTELSAQGTAPLSIKPQMHKLPASTSTVAIIRLPLAPVFTKGADMALVNVAFWAEEPVESRQFLFSRSDPAVLTRPMDERLKQLRTNRNMDAAYTRSLAICKERVDLFSLPRNPERSAQFLLNIPHHQSEIRHELKLLTSGLNPYRDKGGDFYRPLIPSSGAAPIPCRIYFPAELVRGHDGFPLVITLCDSGGDESIFFNLGDGEIKRLANQHQLIVVSPLPSDRIATPSALDEIISQLVADYAVDTSRIYLIGHGSGARLAATLAQNASSKLAGVVCFSTPDCLADTRAPIAPMLLFGGDLDRITPPPKTAKQVKPLRDSGLPIEFRQIKNYGHTLIVGAKLNDAIDWLMLKKLGSAPANP